MVPVQSPWLCWLARGCCLVWCWDLLVSFQFVDCVLLYSRTDVMKNSKQNNSDYDEQYAERMLKNGMLFCVIIVFSVLFLVIGWDLAERYIC